MDSADKIEDPVVRSNVADWKGYLSSVHSNNELEREVSDDYSQELSDIKELEDLDDLLGQELERNRKSKKQLAYDFGYSIAKTYEENNENTLDLYPDSTFLMWFEEFTANGSKAPNPQYAIKGMTDFMEQTQDYNDIF